MKIKTTDMAKKADEACALLKAISHPHRLMILCQLVEGEKSVGVLAETLNLRPSTMSQNLSLLRHHGIVGARREAQTMWYSIKSTAAHALLQTLYGLYCSEKSACPPPKKAR